MTKRSNGTVGLDPEVPRVRHSGILVRADGDGKPSPSGQAYDHRFIASTERLASDGGVILVSAWNIPVFLQRPRWIAMHDIMGWSAPVNEIALGRVVDAQIETGLPLDQVGPTGRALVEYVRYARTAFAQDVKVLFEDGGLDDVSVRWDPRTEQSRAPFEEEVQRYGEGTYWICTYAEQLELSAVLLGADSGAQIVRGKVLEAFERVRAGGGNQLPALEQWIREQELTKRVLIACREFAGTPMEQAVADTVTPPADAARAAGAEAVAPSTGSMLACMDCGEPFAADAEGMGWDGEGDARKPVCPTCVVKREASTQEPVDGDKNDIPALDASLPAVNVIDLSADDRAKAEAAQTKRVQRWAQFAGRMAARGVDVSAMQDVMERLGNVFDALDAVLSAMDSVRRDVDENFTELRNLMAGAMDPDANDETPNDQADPNGEGSQDDDQGAGGSGDGGNNPASGAAAADAQQAQAESDAKKKKQPPAKSTAKSDAGALNDAGANRSDDGATGAGTEADDAPIVRFDLEALGIRSSDDDIGDDDAVAIDWDALLAVTE